MHCWRCWVSFLQFCNTCLKQIKLLNRENHKSIVLENIIAYGMQCCIYRGSLVCWVNLRATFLCKFFYVSNDISHHHFHLMLQHHLWPPPRYWASVCVCNHFWRVMTRLGSLIRPRIIFLQTKLIGVLTNAPPVCSCDAPEWCVFKCLYITVGNEFSGRRCT